MNEKLLKDFIDKSIQEDIKDGDHTSICCIPENKHGIAYLISKQDAIVAGVDLAKEIFNYYDKNLKVDIYSLGLIMYYIFTNEQPFSSYNSNSMDNYMKMEDVIFSTIKIKNIHLRTIINKCIDKDPNNRYNIDELYIDWINFISNLPKERCIIS